ncbi:MAG: GNAT family N-acetyltransferase [Saprospiraceae bacterium]|nr:GNAT family N-acetyltransferase [Saprospiraceae bacterium]
MKATQIVSVSPENISELGLFCIKDKSAVGFQTKENWFKNNYKSGLRLKIAQNDAGEQMGFIEYVPAEFAWRPIKAPGYLFIHCIMIYPNKFRDQGVGTALLQACEEDARLLAKNGIAVMTSKGTWIANGQLFEKNGFTKTVTQGRFDLLVKKLKLDAPDPTFIDWQEQQSKYQGWHLVYADQCPWHEKAVQALQESAVEYGFELQITKLHNPQEAQLAPSGYGVFSLIHNGKLLEDHYISKTRFENILRKELAH